LSPHVDISSYCIKENTEESKQASVFQQVTRRRSHTQITKKRKGVGLGEWRPDIFTGGGGVGELSLRDQYIRKTNLFLIDIIQFINSNL
jgi:hypothetical protein